MKKIFIIIIILVHSVNLFCQTNENKRSHNIGLVVVSQIDKIDKIENADKSPIYFGDFRYRNQYIYFKLYNWGSKKQLYTEQSNETDFLGRDEVINIELEIMYKKKWVVFQSRYPFENLNSVKNNISINKNSCVWLKLDGHDFLQGGKRYNAKLVFQDKNSKEYCSNEFDVYLTEEQIESAKEYFKWD